MADSVDILGWVHCPLCTGKTKTKVNADTIMKRFPLFCPRCKRESIVDVENRTVTVYKF